MNNRGAWFATFSELAASEVAQDEFFGRLVTFVINYGYDGDDLNSLLHT